MHGNFVLRTSKFISSRVVEPGATFVFLTGTGLIITRGYNPLEQRWVGLAIILFVITFTYANHPLVQGPTVKRMIALTSQPPPIIPDASVPSHRPGRPRSSVPGRPRPPVAANSCWSCCSRSWPLMVVKRGF